LKEVWDSYHMQYSISFKEAETLCDNANNNH
jgi:hypothetical protein